MVSLEQLKKEKRKLMAERKKLMVMRKKVAMNKMREAKAKQEFERLKREVKQLKNYTSSSTIAKARRYIDDPATKKKLQTLKQKTKSAWSKFQDFADKYGER